MASMTMTASFLAPGGAAASTITKQYSSSTTHRLRGLIACQCNASRSFAEGDKKSSLQFRMNSSSSSNGRRELIFAAAAAAACSISKLAMADEPKNGTPEAKKKYAAVCVTMPTARFCHK